MKKYIYVRFTRTNNYYVALNTYTEGLYKVIHRGPLNVPNRAMRVDMCFDTSKRDINIEIIDQSDKIEDLFVYFL